MPVGVLLWCPRFALRSKSKEKKKAHRRAQTVTGLERDFLFTFIIRPNGKNFGLYGNPVLF